MILKQIINTKQTILFYSNLPSPYTLFLSRSTSFINYVLQRESFKKLTISVFESILCSYGNYFRRQREFLFDDNFISFDILKSEKEKERKSPPIFSSSSNKEINLSDNVPEAPPRTSSKSKVRSPRNIGNFNVLFYNTFIFLSKKCFVNVD